MRAMSHPGARSGNILLLRLGALPRIARFCKTQREYNEMGIVWRASSKLIRTALLLIAALASFAPIPNAMAQQTPTPAQMEAFRNLPPDQQQAVLEAMQGRGAGVTRRDQQLASPQPTVPEGQLQQSGQGKQQPVGPPDWRTRWQHLLPQPSLSFSKTR